tara:strand:+ start:922 stop:1218 length:297 start_codon:yes stop_codon:yes gene_type:complete
MTKKGPLSKVEKFFIENNYKEMDVEKLCKEMDRTKGVVQKCVTECNTKESKKFSTIDSQFARNDKGATVMTPNASQMIDEMRGHGNNSRQERCTTSIK